MALRQATPTQAEPPAAAARPAAARVEPRMVVVSHGGEILAHSTCVLRLEMESVAPALFVPMADVRMALLTPSERVVQCPLRGRMRYWSVTVGGETVADAAISLEQPEAICSRLSDHIAFDPDRIDEVLTVAHSA